VGARWSKDNRAIQLLLPFAGTVVITMVVLTITIMIVKTQLTELAIVLLVISGWGWSRVWRDSVAMMAPMPIAYKRMLFGAVTLVVIGGALAMMPSMVRQERLLGEVRDVRNNANDAIKWSAIHLPKNATLAMPGYLLYGYRRIDDLSTADDATKVGSQYVFHGGYPYTYLSLLNRSDIQSYPLEDTLKFRSQLDSLREMRGFLFLQSELDHQKFDSGLLGKSDTLLRAFSTGGFHTEIWQLRK
jgi:hypothetical protein